MAVGSELSGDYVASSPQSGGDGRPARRSLSVWHVTGAAALIVFALLAFNLYRLDRAAGPVAEIASGTASTSAGGLAPLGVAKPEPAPATATATVQEPSRWPERTAPTRDETVPGPILQSLLQSAPSVAPADERSAAAVERPSASADENAAVLSENTAARSSALERALARAEAAAAGVVRSSDQPDATIPLAVGARVPPPSGIGSPSGVKQAAIPQSSPLRVFLHFTAGDPDERDKAERLAAELRSRGLTVADIRPVRQSVRSSMIRFYHDSDRPELGILTRALAEASSRAGTPADWYVSDFTRYASPPRVGNVEVWIPNG